MCVRYEPARSCRIRLLPLPRDTREQICLPNAGFHPLGDTECPISGTGTERLDDLRYVVGAHIRVVDGGSGKLIHVREHIISPWITGGHRPRYPSRDAKHRRPFGVGARQPLGPFGVHSHGDRHNARQRLRPFQLDRDTGGNTCRPLHIERGDHSRTGRTRPNRRRAGGRRQSSGSRPGIQARMEVGESRALGTAGNTRANQSLNSPVKDVRAFC